MEGDEMRVAGSGFDPQLWSNNPTIKTSFGTTTYIITAKYEVLRRMPVQRANHTD